MPYNVGTGWEQFVGLLDYHTRFELDSVSKQLLVDLGTVHDMAELWINGEHAGKRLWLSCRFDLQGKLRPGKNSFRIRMGYRVNSYYSNPIPSGLLGPVKLEIVQQIDLDASRYPHLVEEPVRLIEGFLKETNSMVNRPHSTFDLEI